MDSKAQKVLAQANARLKDAKVGVTLEYREQGGGLYLRGTFPPKPESGQDKPYRQRVPLKNEYGLMVRGTPAGIQYAEQRAKQLSAELSLGKFNWVNWRSPTVDPQSEEHCWLALWDQFVEQRSKVVSRTTVTHDYRRIRNHVVNLAERGLASPYEMRDFLVAEYTPNTAKRVLVHLNACCKWAVERSLLETNPFENLARGIKVPAHQETVDPFSKEEVERIIQGFTESRYYKHYLNFVKFLFMTGCRTSEAVGLCWGHINEEMS